MSKVVNPAKPLTQQINILHLYPHEMNIYGDRGNILALTRRLQWRGFGVTIIEAGIGQEVDISKADIIFGGGGQDLGQIRVGKDMQRHSAALRTAMEDSVPMLVVCGMYQLFGNGFTTVDGNKIKGIGLLDLKTEGSHLRMIGNTVVDTDFGRVVGFENHSGRTLLSESQKPFGKVKRGYGNDGKSGYEGARKKNVFGTYLHGPILPKNPEFSDGLILLALKKKYKISKLEPLDDAAESAAAQVAESRPQ